MMNVMRIVIVIQFIIALICLILTGIDTGNFLDGQILLGFFKDLAETLFFGCGIIAFDIWFASCINRKKKYGKHYTRIMVPSFLFIICADIFFTIISIMKGGIFRGWFSKKRV